MRDPIHVLWNSSSCNDLIFMNKTNFVLGSRTHPFLHSNCNHQIVYANLILKRENCLSLYRQFVWDYKSINTQLLNHTNEIFNWGKLLEKNNANDKLHPVNKIMLNIFHSFNPNEGIICHDKSHPWTDMITKSKS